MWVTSANTITKGDFTVAHSTVDLNQLRIDSRGSLLAWIRENAPDNSEQIYRLKRNLKTAIENDLTGPQRTYLSMYYFEGLSMTEIGERVGVDKSTVSRTIARARARLNRALKYSF